MCCPRSAVRVLIVSSGVPRYLSMNTRLRPAGVWSSGYLSCTFAGRFGPGGSRMFSIAAPGTAVCATAAMESSDSSGLRGRPRAASEVRDSASGSTCASSHQRALMNPETGGREEKEHNRRYDAEVMV